MIYVMSDLHGCYDKYIQMIEKINLTDDDTLYILGDVTDRGEHGIKILLDMMNRFNVIPLLGNHDLMAYRVLKSLNKEITEDNYEEMIEFYQAWMYNGGDPTLKAFLNLTSGMKVEVLEYLGDFELYEELDVNGRSFVLVHGGLEDFSEDKDLSEYSIEDIVWSRCDYEKQYYADKFLVTGHTPTGMIDKEYDGKIYSKHNHIAIDCGAAYDRPLGCICLDTLEEFYV